MSTPTATQPEWQSCIFEGWVRHRRQTPAHDFTYNLFLMYLDLDELDQLFQNTPGWRVGPGPALARFDRRDYLGDPRVPLHQAVREEVYQHAGFRPTGPIRMLTHMRYLGHCFNPVSFYYCFEPDGKTPSAVVAQINNTPWDERFSYVMIPYQSGPRMRFHMAKDFHVSPFMPMDQSYRWTFSTPSDTLAVHMENHTEAKQFDATLLLHRREITSANLNRVLVRYPFMTVRVVAAIYWQAFQLFLKRTPFYTHPAKIKEVYRENT